ncbi:MAG: serine hydroxymethyltransferase [Alphaproteobacteria bacterium]|nr:serine hydroxymethyltransferase [Alphaproteobacteria bacterium]
MSAVVAAEAPSVDELYVSVAQEWVKQQFSWNMVASESLASHSVCALQGSVLTNKYAEGYPGARYYGGCAVVDVVESLAQERAKSLFNCQFANVQPHSGSQANQAVYTALLDAGDTILGMDLAHGGHLTHGFPINSSGKLYKGIAYPVVKQTGLIDYDEVERLAVKHNPRLIIAGASAYSRIIDYKRFRVIADKVGAYLMADIAHIAGLIAAGILPSPFPYASVVTSTTHKTLKGPRGGLILCEDQEMSSKINKGVFPGTQGGPLMHVIAAKAQAFKEASTDAYKAMMHNVVEGAQLMSKTLRSEGFDVLTGGTDNHKILVDLRSMRVEGKVAEDRLAAYCIFANKNMVPYDTASPMNPSGIRLGSMALACRGMKGDIFAEVAHIIAEIILDKPECDHRARIAQLCARYPINTAPSDEN